MKFYLVCEKSRKTGKPYICMSYCLGESLYPITFKLEDILCFTNLSSVEVKSLPLGSKILLGSFVADKVVTE